MMKRISFVSISVVLLASEALAAAPQPNILLILADDLGWSDVGFSGAGLVETPNIDRLARAGATFPQFYATPTCTPSRAVLLTGQYGPRHGNYAVDVFAGTPSRFKRITGQRSAMHLPMWTKTIADVLRDAGYETALIGKWHLGGKPGRLPTDYGFDINIAGDEVGRPDSFFAPYGNVDLEPKRPGEYLTDRLTDEAVEYIERKRAKPFFLYYSAYAVHVPLHARRAFMPPDTGEPGTDDPVPPYVGMVRHFDACVGRLVDAIPRTAGGRKTIVFFTSDNGGQSLATSNRPLRGQKGTVYEGGIRVPAFFWAPGRISAGTIVETPAALQDILPTLVEFAGARLPDQKLDGVSLAPLFKKRSIDRESLFWHLTNYTGNLRTNAHVWQPPVSVIRRGPWKLIEHFEDGALELYNIDTDIGETTNLAEEEPGRANMMLADLKRWQRETGAPVPSAPNNEFDSRARAENIGLANQREPDEWEALTLIKE